MNKTKLAHWVSVMGHPFVMIVLLVLALSWTMEPAAAWRITGFVAAMGLVPTGWLVSRRVSGKNSKAAGASPASSRTVLYLTMLAVLVISGGYFYLVEHAEFLARGSAMTALMVVVAAVLSRWIRLSLHLAFASYSGLILAAVHLAYGLPILLLVPVLAWSRLVLGRHTLPEVIGGSVLGLAAAALLMGLWYHG
jgi:membrane-associated phospholipid phosphatase